MPVRDLSPWTAFQSLAGIFFVGDTMNLISLTKGYTTAVDDEDFQWLSTWKWHVIELKKKVYARTYIAGENRHMYMHRLLMCHPKEMDVDHVNGDGLDNRKENIQVVSRKEHRIIHGFFQRRRCSEF